MDAARSAVCTICSANYLHYARTLFQSVHRIHPDWHLVVLIVDSLDDIDESDQPFTVMGVKELPLPDIHRFLFRYSQLELNTAVKPWVMQHLLDSGAERVIYLDPDIRAYSPFDELESAFDDGASVVFTPHLTGPVVNPHCPEEYIMAAGIWNLGFVAVQNCDPARSFLAWWQGKLEFDCVNDAPRLFVDQKWCDLAPGMFDDVRILRHEGYNVAYWNLAHRDVTDSSGRVEVNGKPLRFFHYSGLDPHRPETFAKYVPGIRLSRQSPTVRRLTREYVKAVHDQGLQQYSGSPYAFGSLADGASIPDVLRQIGRSDRSLEAMWGGDPFQLTVEQLNEPIGRTDPEVVPVTLLMDIVWKSRSDLQTTFPRILGADRQGFAQWFVTTGHSDLQIPEYYIEPVRSALEGAGHQLPAKPTGQPARAITALHSLLRSVARRLSPARKAQLKSWAVSAYCRALPLARRLPRSWKGPLRRLAAPVVRATASPVRIPPAESTSSDSGPTIIPFPTSAVSGVNIIGYVRSEMGVGQSARQCIAASRAVDLPHTVVDFSRGCPTRATDYSYADEMTSNPAHGVTIAHVNADQFPTLMTWLGPERTRDRYSIGYWHWELPEFPDEWLSSFDLVDEVWTPTRFVQAAVSDKSPVPVVCIPHCINFDVDPSITRATFGLPDNRFLFLVMYDMYSIHGRKNPEAAVEAYRRAFGDRSDVGLVIKTHNSRSSDGRLSALKERLADVPGAVVIDRTLSRDEVYGLESVCDAFVSLHRSEGFGLGPAECMYLGKPVVVTNWSGNVDFTTPKNSCTVDYQLVQLDRDHGPYRAGQTWAEPDVDHAAWYMQKLVTDAQWRRNIAQAGQAHIRTELSPEAIGRLYQKRLSLISRSFRQGSSDVEHLRRTA